MENPELEFMKIVADPDGMEESLVKVFLEAHPEAPEQVIPDVDATDDPLHGKQEEGRLFHGDYKYHCRYTSPAPIICCVLDSARRIEARPTGWRRS